MYKQDYKNMSVTLYLQTLPFRKQRKLYQGLLIQ